MTRIAAARKWLESTFAGEPATIARPQAARWKPLLALAAWILAVLAVTLWVRQKPQDDSLSQVGIDAAPTSRELRRIGTALATADEKGDRAGADALIDDVSAVLRTLNDQADQPGGAAMRDCRLAGAHLAQGIVSVGEGGGWHARSKFDAAMRGCKS